MDTNGGAIEHTVVTLRRLDAAAVKDGHIAVPVLGTGDTDGNGEFSIANVPAGIYEIRVKTAIGLTGQAATPVRVQGGNSRVIGAGENDKTVGTESENSAQRILTKREMDTTTQRPVSPSGPFGNRTRSSCLPRSCAAETPADQLATVPPDRRMSPAEARHFREALCRCA